MSNRNQQLKESIQTHNCLLNTNVILQIFKIKGGGRVMERGEKERGEKDGVRERERRERVREDGGSDREDGGSKRKDGGRERKDGGSE